MCILLCLSPVVAEEKKPCLIFTSDAGADYAVDLMKYNRITFGEESMTLTNSETGGASLSVLYSAYNRFKVGEAEPSQLAIDELSAESPVQFSYSKARQIISLSSDSGIGDEVYRVGVFNLAGSLVLSALLRSGESLSVESLAMGAYVAIAVGEKSTQSLKFVK